jgi:hypothetical protein
MASIQLTRYKAEEGDLPNVCMRCGEPDTERKRLRFTSHPLWVYVLLPFGYIVYAIVAAVLTENVRCYTQFCHRHKNHWFIRTLIIWVGFVALLVFIVSIIIVVASLASKATMDSLFGYLSLGSVLLMFCWLISIPLIQLTSIHAAEVSKRRITLKCISPEFADAVLEYRKKRRAEDEREGWQEDRVEIE